MNAPHLQATPVRSIQHKLGLISCALLGLALIGSIVHDLGASPSHSDRAGIAVWHVA